MPRLVRARSQSSAEAADMQRQVSARAARWSGARSSSRGAGGVPGSRAGTAGVLPSEEARPRARAAGRAGAAGSAAGRAGAAAGGRRVGRGPRATRAGDATPVTRRFEGGGAHLGLRMHRVRGIRPVTAPCCHAPAWASNLASSQAKGLGFAHEGAVSRACFGAWQGEARRNLSREPAKSARDLGAVSRAGFGPLQRRNEPLSRAGMVKLPGDRAR